MSSPPTPEAKKGEALQLGANYAENRRRARQERRARIHAQVLHPIDTPTLLRDPLYHPSSPIDSTITIFKLVLAAAAIHGVIILVFSVVNDLMGDSQGYRPNDRVVINIVDRTDPDEREESEEEEEEEEAPVLPDFEPKEIEKPREIEKPKEVEKPKPKPKLKPKKPKEVRKPEPESGPITPDTTPPKRRHIGINYESTVEGGKGPALQTGTSRMGETDEVAADPKEAAKEGASTGKKKGGAGSGDGQREQRKAAFIPTAGGVFIKPKRVRPSKPPYPSTLKAQGIEGDVLVRVTIDNKGKVTDVKILKGSGHREFDDAARKAPLAEKFTPATKDGKGVPFTISYSYRFRIEEK